MPLSKNNQPELNAQNNVPTPDTHSIQINKIDNPTSAVNSTSRPDLPPLSPRTNAAIVALELENARVRLLTEKMAKLIACDIENNDNSLEIGNLIDSFLKLNAQDIIVQYNNKLQSLSMIALDKGLYKIANLLIQDDYSKGNYKILNYRSTAESKNVLEELENILITDPELEGYFTGTQEQQHPHKTRYNTEDNDSSTIAGNIASNSAIVDDVQNNINVPWTQEMVDIIIKYPHNNDNPSEVTELTRSFLALNAQDTLVEHNNKLQSLSMMALEKGLPSAASLLIYDDCMRNKTYLLHHRSSPESNNVVEKLITMFTQQGVEAFFNRIKNDMQAAIRINNTENTTLSEQEEEQFPDLPRDPNRNPLLDAPKKSLPTPDWLPPQAAGITLFPELHGEHLLMNDGMKDNGDIEG